MTRPIPDVHSAPNAGAASGTPEIRHLGLRSYADVLELQHDLVEQRIQGHVPDTVILCQHPSVVTIGRGSRAPREARHPSTGEAIPIVPIRRGGQATWHGPGQLVGYPIVDLRARSRDIHGFLRHLEQLLIDTLGVFDIAAGRRKGLTGVWVDDRKIASIGIAVRRWVTYHGFALNVDPDLAAFGAINPCGLSAGVMTSMAVELGQARAVAEVRSVVEERIPAGALAG